MLRTSIDKIRENGFELKKKRSRRYPAKTVTDAVYADDIALLANTPNQAETLLHRLGRTAAGIGLHVNAHKTEYMWFNQTDDISTLDGTSLKLEDKFTYLGSSVSSTEKDIRKPNQTSWSLFFRLLKTCNGYFFSFFFNLHSKPERSFCRNLYNQTYYLINWLCIIILL